MEREKKRLQAIFYDFQCENKMTAATKAGERTDLHQNVKENKRRALETQTIYHTHTPIRANTQKGF